MDNGWMKFNSYRVNKDALLDRFGKVDDEGNYTSDIKSEGKRFAMTISCLTGGRVILARNGAENALQGLAISIRFSLARWQFGNKKLETLIMDYPLH